MVPGSLVPGPFPASGHRSCQGVGRRGTPSLVKSPVPGPARGRGYPDQES